MNRLVLTPLLFVMLATGPAGAQQTTVIQAENVRYAYARVLRVTPVFQTLTATRSERRCDSVEQAEDGSGLKRVVGAVRGALRRNERPGENCRTVQVEREFRRPIAYDVDYTYRGAKYRSRLAEDPGNHLRIRVSVMPVVAPRGN